MSAPGAIGELLIDVVLPNPVAWVEADGWVAPGVPLALPINVPNDPALVGTTVYVQGYMSDANGVNGLTNGLELVVEP